MKKTSKTKRTASAESIARLADKGHDISAYFTNKGKMMPPLDSVGIDLNKDMLEELNEAPAVDGSGPIKAGPIPNGNAIALVFQLVSDHCPPAEMPA